MTNDELLKKLEFMRKIYVRILILMQYLIC